MKKGFGSEPGSGFSGMRDALIKAAEKTPSANAAEMVETTMTDFEILSSNIRQRIEEDGFGEVANYLTDAVNRLIRLSDDERGQLIQIVRGYESYAVEKKQKETFDYVIQMLKADLES